jgi:DNA-binding NarL/FixJ family response regulator
VEKYSIALVDDHTLFREGLRLILENLDYVEEVRDFATGTDFLVSLNDYRPDLVFMDIEMSGKDGIGTTREALEVKPGLKIIALSMYSDEEYYTEMINAGARGFIIKSCGIQDVENAIQQVVSGSNYFSGEILQRLINGFVRQKKKVPSARLTEREEEVLFHICTGLSNHQIAEKLHLSKRTVDKHRENILSKTGASNTAGLVIYAVRNGIVEI